MLTQDIIKMLPVEESEKIRLLNLYERGTETQQTEIGIMAWACYFEMYNDRVQENLNDEFDEISKGQGGPLDKTLYAQALKKTEEEMNKETTESVAETDLTLARNAMKQIMNEIHAAKDAKKAAKKKTS